MEVLDTCECSGQISSTPCHFCNRRSVFPQILHQSWGLWDITPLYILAKTLYTLRSLPKYLVTFYVSSWQPEILHFDGLLVSKSCKVSVKKVQKSYLSWHWTVIQILKKISLFVWETWWILTWAVKNLKICTLMGYFYQKYVTFELK